ncbi:MAG: hypothetical protein QM755_19260 [Luteolibacter sp.]
MKTSWMIGAGLAWACLSGLMAQEEPKKAPPITRGNLDAVLDDPHRVPDFWANKRPSKEEFLKSLSEARERKQSQLGLWIGFLESGGLAAGSMSVEEVRGLCLPESFKVDAKEGVLQAKLCFEEGRSLDGSRFEIREDIAKLRVPCWRVNMTFDPSSKLIRAWNLSFGLEE